MYLKSQAVIDYTENTKKEKKRKKKENHLYKWVVTWKTEIQQSFHSDR